MSKQSDISQIERRIDRLSDSHRLKGNVVDVVEDENQVWDGLIGLQHFGRADIGDLHAICDDWEVYNRDIDGAIVTVGVDLDGMVPIGGDSL